MVYLLKEFVAGIPCAFCLERKKCIVIIFLILCPIDVSSDANSLRLIVDAIEVRQFIEPHILGVHIHTLKGFPKVTHSLARTCHLIGGSCLICHICLFVYCEMWAVKTPPHY